MPAPPLSRDVLIETVQFLEAAKGDMQLAAKMAKINYKTFHARVKQAKARSTELYSDELEFPDLPSSELSAKELIDQACKRYTTHSRAKDARKWMEIKLRQNKPIGIVFMGDPHIDNSGTNWPLLKRDIAILEQTEGLYVVNIGDLTDNWVGRLVRLYADSEMSKKQAWKLAKYLLKDTKIKWLCHILGNHDLWNDGEYLIKANAHPRVPVESWQARFQVVFPNDTRIRIHAAHDFPGTSIWNPQHGPQKAAMMFDQADIFACGHKHTWAINEGENAQRDYVYWLIRARGYKHIDSYADQRGFGSQQYGASITAIIDPTVKDTRKIRCFPDLAEAAEFLKFKRRK